MKNPLLVVLLSLATTVCVQAGVTVTPTRDGLQIKGDGEYLKFTLGYPTLSTADKKKEFKPKGVEVKDNTAIVKYEGGGEVDVAVDAAAGTVTLKGENLSSEVGAMSMRMVVDPNFRTGGTYQFGGKAVTPFPENKPEKPHLFQGNAPTLTIRAADGKGVVITVPLYSYQEITDMREWGTNSYGYMSLVNFTPDAAVTYKFEDAGPAPAPADAGATPAPAAQ